VLLAGDIDRGGVFAALVGTMELLAPDDRQRVRGFIINKFRGDASLLLPGFDLLTARTGVPVLGVVPYMRDRLVPAEDSLSLDDERVSSGPHVIDIAVVRLPRISNFDDFEPLAEEPQVRLRFITRRPELDGADLIIIPGSKTTIPDLDFLRQSGFAEAIVARASAGTPVIGICGGYQMLGTLLRDPHQVDSRVMEIPGLGLLPVTTTFARRKTTVRAVSRVAASSGLFAGAEGEAVNGYEIHTGLTEVHGGSRLFEVVERAGRAVDDLEGAVNQNGNVLGTYLHGLFANSALRRALLTNLAARKGVRPDPRWGSAPTKTARYDRLADIVDASLDMSAIAKLIGLDYPNRATS
jgi:adenosylcobyric acid synthase